MSGFIQGVVFHTIKKLKVKPKFTHDTIALRNDHYKEILFRLLASVRLVISCYIFLYVHLHVG